MRKIVIIGLIGLMNLLGEVHGQHAASLSRDTIVLGDTTVLTVEGMDSSLWSMVSNQYIEVLKEELSNGTGKYWLTSYDPGARYVKWSESDSLRLVVLGVDIDPNSDEPKESADIEDIVEIEEEEGSLWNILLPLAVVLLIGGLLLWWWKRGSKKNVETIEQPAVALTAEERTLARLEALKKENLWQVGKVKEYYTGITDILREYIEETTGIHATEMTSEECINSLASKGTNTDAITFLNDIFATADLVKFAKGEPSKEEHDKTYETAVAFVQLNVNREKSDE